MTIVATGPAVSEASGSRPTRHGPDPAARARARRRDRRRERWTLVVLGAVLVAVTFANSWGQFAPDTKPDLYFAPGRFLNGTLSAWLPDLGQAGRGNFNTGMAPVAVVIYVLRALGLAPWVAVRVWRLGFLFLAAWGIRRYFHDLMDGHTNRLGRTAVTVLYVANAFVITQGNTTPELLPYALLPWLLLAHRRSMAAPRSWRRAALFALAFFAMTGMNAGVVPLFLVLAVPCQMAASHVVDHIPWRDLGRSLWRCITMSVGVSLYWLLPTALASGTGAGIAAATESPRAVALTTSYAEAGRLLGHWPVYGRFGARLYEPSYVSYITSPWVVTATFLVLVGAAFSVWWVGRARRRVRVTAGLLLAVAVPIEVGLFPPDHMSVVGQAIDKVFAAVPATLAFRTTSKIGPLVVLALVLCVGIGAVEASKRSRSWHPAARYASALLATAVVAGSVYPALSNQLYDSAWTVPSYWKQAAITLNSAPDADTSRVLAVPGGAGGNYRWGMRSPDDVFPSLFVRNVVSHTTVAGEGDTAANLMAGVDGPLNDGTLAPGAVSVLSRYLGASQVLVRNDTRYEELQGGSPATITSAVKTDGGLRRVATFGRTGESVERTDLARSDQQADLRVHPLEQYAVTDPVPTIRAEAAPGALLVDGDGFALPDLARTGLLDGRRPFRLMGELDATSLKRSLDDGAGVVLTDTNRRRTWNLNRLTDAFSNTQPAEADVHAGEGPTLTLYPDRTETQTVTRLENVARIDASPLDFGVHAYGKPQMAFDADPSTRWNAGPFGTARGKHLTVVFNQPRPVSQVSVAAANDSPARVTQVAVEAGGQQRLVDIRPGGGALATFPNVEASAVTVTITAVSPGDNPVGLASIDIPGMVATEVARLPTTFTNLFAELDGPTRAKVAEQPLDVLFTRQAASTESPDADEERALNREFSLPVRRTFSFSATVRSLGDVPTAVSAAWAAAPSPETAPCAQVGTLDDVPVLVRPDRSVRGLPPGQPISLQRCDPGPTAGANPASAAANTINLGVGVHQLRSSQRWLVGSVRLSSKGTAPSARQSGPAVRVVAHDDTHARLQVPATGQPFYLVTGQAFDPRWQATANGASLGPPALLDGYSVGWRLPPGGARRVDVVFGPQRYLRLSFALSIAVLVGIVTLLTVPLVVARRRRRRSPAP